MAMGVLQAQALTTTAGRQVLTPYEGEAQGMRKRDCLDDLLLELMSDASQEVDGLSGIVVVFVDDRGCISCRIMHHEETPSVARGVVEKVKEAVKSSILGTVQEMGEVAVKMSRPVRKIVPSRKTFPYHQGRQVGNKFL